MLNSNKIILDLCGGTGSWSAPYRDAGYDVRLMTLPDNDVRLLEPVENVYGILAAPPCTEFSFAKHFHGHGNYTHDFLAGLEVVSACLRLITVCRPKFWALENPKGYLQRWMGQPCYSFEPWQFGDNYQKQTDLWGDFEKPQKNVAAKPDDLVKFSMLKSKDIHPEFYGKLDRQTRRAITPKGFAQAFFDANR